MMIAFQDTARRVRVAWGPGHTAIVIAVVGIAIGFLPFVKMALVVNGVFVAGIIGVGAIGLTLVYGILNFSNLCHGDYMTM